MSLQYGDEEQLPGSYGAADSFPKDFGYGVEDGDLEESEAPSDTKPRILLMGLRRSGKSSIQKVVFHKMSPNETLFLESTNKIYKDDISNSSFVNFQIWDFPGQMDFFDPTFDYEMIFRGTGALIYVIDAQVLIESQPFIMDMIASKTLQNCLRLFKALCELPKIKKIYNFASLYTVKQMQTGHAREKRRPASIL